MATDRLTTPNTAGIVLTGGLSSRMGTNKAELVVNGVPMAERVLAAARQAGIAEIVVAGSAELPDISVTGAAGSPTTTGSQGPLAGIVTGWTALQQRGDFDVIVVLSCDLPSLSTAVISALIAACPSNRHGVVAHDGERPQPLIAAYRPVALDGFQRSFLAGERSVRRCFSNWDLGHLRFDAHDLTDADTPADLERFVVQWPTDSATE